MSGRLSPRRARTFYNVADAWIPPGAGPGAGDVDLAPALETRMADWRGWRVLRLALLLRWIEAAPRWTGSGGFSSLPRAERARRLAAWESSRLPLQRQPARALRRLVESLWADHSPGGP